MRSPDFHDNGWLLVAATNQHVAERRFDRPYDEQSPATLYMPDGSKVATFDRAFSNVAAREVLALHLAAR